jgi:lactoylglutathione lyase
VKLQTECACIWRLRVRSANSCRAPSVLKAIGVVPKGFNGEPVEEPIVIGWMPAISLHFTDPDGHLLEYLVMLPVKSCLEVGVIPYSQWEIMQQQA